MEKTYHTRWSVPRPVSSRVLRIRIIGIILLIWLVHQQRLFLAYHNALSAKYAPTEFHGIDLERAYPLGGRASTLQAELLANRPSWKKLGSGCEGTTFVLNDIVIKTFTSGRSPFRNCAPRPASSRWPAEIPASLIFGNGEASNSSTPFASQGANKIRCLPVRTAFYAASSPGATPEWHLATPLAPNGTLKSFSKNVHTRGLGFNTLDAQYREKFHDLLQSLQGLHDAGFCHDDIKPDNIFIGEEGEWILGDLGNVRHVAHPYHASRLWSDNQQLRDCRANDILRAMKTYILFLRTSSLDVERLDEELLSRREPLAKLFWWTMDNALTMTGDELRQQSSLESAWLSERTVENLQEMRVGRNGVLSLFSLGSLRVSRTVDKILSLSNSESYARLKAMTWIFGIQQGACSGV